MSDPFGTGKAKGFSKSRPPGSKEEAEEWQKTNKNWWESHPMRYDHRIESVDGPKFSPEFFEEIDRRFLGSVGIGFPWRNIPFDQFIDYDNVPSQDVLEIGVGCGTHAQLLSERARSYTGIDLTDYAVEATTRRLELSGLNGRIIQMDAEKMDFPDASFDFVWSWGVIHHSSDTRAILRQIHRVLKPGGKAVFMVYHQSPWNTYIRCGLYYGLLKGQFFRGLDAHQIVQMNTDGALARYYTPAELKADLGNMFDLNRVDYLGSKFQLIPLKYGRLKEWCATLIPNSFGRWVTNRPLFAYMQVATCKKIT